MGGVSLVCEQARAAALPLGAPADAAQCRKHASGLCRSPFAHAAANEMVSVPEVAS